MNVSTETRFTPSVALRKVAMTLSLLTHVPASDILANKRGSQQAETLRHVVVGVCRTELDYSQAQVMRALGRSHETIANSCRQFGALRENASVDALVRALILPNWRSGEAPAYAKRRAAAFQHVWAEERAVAPRKRLTAPKQMLKGKRAIEREADESPVETDTQVQIALAAIAEAAPIRLKGTAVPVADPEPVAQLKRAPAFKGLPLAWERAGEGAVFIEFFAEAQKQATALLRRAVAGLDSLGWPAEQRPVSWTPQGWKAVLKASMAAAFAMLALAHPAAMTGYPQTEGRA